MKLNRKTIVVPIVLLLLGFADEPAMGQNRDWLGTYSGYWSNPNNWDPAGTPQSGETLQFGYVNDSNRTMTNDLANVAVYGLGFAANDYQIYGNSITLAIVDNENALNEHNSRTTTINCPLSFPSGGAIVGGNQKRGENEMSGQFSGKPD